MKKQNRFTAANSYLNFLIVMTIIVSVNRERFYLFRTDASHRTHSDELLYKLIHVLDWKESYKADRLITVIEEE